MKARKERRKWPRDNSASFEIGIIYPRYVGDGDITTGNNSETWIVRILDRSEGGLLVESPLSFEAASSLDIRIRLPKKKVWMAVTGKVVRAVKSPHQQNYFLLGIQFPPGTFYKELANHSEVAGEKRMSPSDLEFFAGTPLSKAISDQAKSPLLNSLTPSFFKAGERIITQGERGDTVYMVQEGSCVAYLEKDGTKHPVADLRAGDIIGEIALLTGAARTAHVDAQTDVKLWRLTRRQFDDMCEETPDVRNFLTELVSHRFSREKVTAERVIGKYTVNDIIGRGGWSIVYKGVHASLNMPVAIKMLKHDMAMDPVFSDKFRQEAKIIARFNHENIVKVYDIEELYRTIFIITEYLEGQPLDYLIEEIVRLPPRRALDILLQVCAGLNYAHEHGIVHQDVKPANIFIQQEDRTKILDFGLACSPGDVDCSMRGTIFYASPEALEGESVDERADIYSLGITAFEMITGEKPFFEHDLSRMIESRLSEELPDPRDFVHDIPDALSTFIMRSTQRDPAKRYRSVVHAIYDLTPLAQRLGVRPHRTLKGEKKMMSLFLFYDNKDIPAIEEALENFKDELKRKGAELQGVHLGNSDETAS